MKNGLTHATRSAKCILVSSDRWSYADGSYSSQRAILLSGNANVQRAGISIKVHVQRCTTLVSVEKRGRVDVRRTWMNEAFVWTIKIRSIESLLIRNMALHPHVGRWYIQFHYYYILECRRRQKHQNIDASRQRLNHNSNYAFGPPRNAIVCVISSD